MRTDQQLVQLLLPLFDNERRDFPRELFERVARELTDRLGGLTTYTRAPAEGRWRDGRAISAAPASAAWPATRRRRPP